MGAKLGKNTKNQRKYCLGYCVDIIDLPAIHMKNANTE
jgi:hypothetical protein